MFGLYKIAMWPVILSSYLNERLKDIAKVISQYYNAAFLKGWNKSHSSDSNTPSTTCSWNYFLTSSSSAILLTSGGHLDSYFLSSFRIAPFVNSPL